ncbi:unnamed protein product, partial [Brassica oleracea]
SFGAAKAFDTQSVSALTRVFFSFVLVVFYYTKTVFSFTIYICVLRLVWLR